MDGTAGAFLCTILGVREFAGNRVPSYPTQTNRPADSRPLVPRGAHRPALALQAGLTLTPRLYTPCQGAQTDRLLLTNPRRLCATVADSCDLGGRNMRPLLVPQLGGNQPTKRLPI